MEICKNTGNWIEMCDFLKEVTTNNYGDIEAQVMSNRGKNSRRLRIVAGKLKNKVEFNHCPFCGVNIETMHKGVV